MKFKLYVFLQLKSVSYIRQAILSTRWLMSIKTALFVTALMFHIGAKGDDSLYLYEYNQARLKRLDGLKLESFKGFGDEVDVSTGDVTFNVTDVDIPGNSKLKVSFQRKMQAVSAFGTIIPNFEMGEWSIDLPNISTKVLYDKINNKYLGDWGNGKACSGSLQPDNNLSNVFKPIDYWNGVFIEVSGEIHENILLNSGYLKSKDSSPKITKSGWLVNCVSNNDGSEAFVVKSPKGLIYTFSQKRVYKSHLITKWINNYQYQADVFKFHYLVTKIEDLFGNYVSYSYEPNGNLRSISANDGRSITVDYSDGRVEKVTANGEVWSYEYDYLFNSSGDSTRAYLTKVTLPSQEYWEYDLKDLSKPYLGFLGNFYPHNCPAYTYTQYEISGVIKAPYGAKSRFSFYPRRFLLEGVYTESDGYRGPSCQIQYSLAERVIENSDGSEIGKWRYEYTQNDSSSEDDNSLPTLISNKRHKWTTVYDSSSNKVVYYFDRIITSNKEGKLEAFDTFNNKGELVERTENHFFVGGKIGNSDLESFYLTDSTALSYNTNAIENQILLDVTTVLIESGKAESTSYTTEYDEFNIFGMPEYVIQYNSAVSGKKHTKVSYYNDVENWVLNLPLSREVSDNGINWTTVESQEYYDSEHLAKTLLYKKYHFDMLIYTNSYHADGNLRLKSFNSPGRWIEFSNYKLGQPQKIKFPKRYSEVCLDPIACFINATQVINDNGTIAAITDFNGNTTNYTYDAMGRLESITPADSAWSPTSISYEMLDGYFTQTISRGNYRKKVRYDGLLRPVLTEEWDSSNAAATRRYTVKHFNADNLAEFISYPSTSSDESQGTVFKYDVLKRLESQYNTLDNKGTSYAYLANNQVRITDARNNSTTITYRAFGSPSQEYPSKIEQPDDVTTDIEYNLFDNITKVKQGGITESRFYNSQQQLCRLVRPDIGHTAYKYNTLGQPVWIAQGASGSATACDEASVTAAQKVSYIYDNLGMLHTINYPDSTPDKVYTYDNQGNLKALAAGTAVWDYSYNSANLMETEVLTLNDISWMIDPTYNALGQVDSITYPSGIRVSYAPNALGQATKAGDYATGATYYPNGQLKGFTFGNGLAYSQILDTQQRPEYQTVKRSTTKLLNHFYQYDANHNIETINDLITPTKNISLTYDDLDRLDTAAGFWGTGSFDYDSLGNIETKTLGNQSLSYVYDTNNRLTGITGSAHRSFGYDTRGNVTSNGVRAFNFNLANQLVSSGTNSYQYDGYNRRVKKISNGKTQLSLYNAAGQLLMTDGDKGLTEYFYLGNKLIAKESAVPTSEDTPGYTGHLEDDDLQLTYMQQRYYDPLIGRFYSNDPVDFLGHMQRGNPTMGFNRYAYANNNPYKFTDPDGRAAFLIIFAPEVIAFGKAAFVVGSAGAAAYAGSKAIQHLNESSEGQSDVKIDDKIKEQLGPRGWTEGEVKDITKTEPTGSSTDKRSPNKTADGQGRNDPASVYGSKNGGHVVVNDNTKEVVHVSDKNDPNWIPDSRIEWKEEQQ